MSTINRIDATPPFPATTGDLATAPPPPIDQAEPVTALSVTFEYGIDADALALAKAIASHWPRGRASITTVKWDDAAPTPRSGPGRPAPRSAPTLPAASPAGALPAHPSDQPGPLIAFIPPGSASTAVRRLIDRIDSTGAPAALLWTTTREERRFAERAGVLVIDPETDPAAIAAALEALTVRQHAVDRLSDEARLDRHHRRRMSLELDHMHQELELASRLQRDLMPGAFPKVDGLEFGLIFRPATYLSGDIYDIAVLPDGRIAFLLADAVGHGVSAALLTVAVTRSLWRADEAFGEDRAALTPAVALARLNHDMCSRWRCERWFITAVCGVYEPDTHRVTLASAGHPPPVVAKPDGSWSKVDVGGPLLGVFDEAEYEETSLTLEPGESIIIYSDGFEVAFPGTDRGTDADALRSPTVNYLGELGTLAADAKTSSTQAAMDRLAARLDLQAGSLHRPDDVTALALRLRG